MCVCVCVCGCCCCRELAVCGFKVRAGARSVAEAQAALKAMSTYGSLSAEQLKQVSPGPPSPTAHKRTHPLHLPPPPR